MYKISKILQYFFIFSLLFSLNVHKLLAGGNEKTNLNQVNLGIAVIDTELIFKKFAEDHNILKKIMNDYKIFLNSNKYAKTTKEGKEQKTIEELDKIIMHYGYQVSLIITNVINDLIKEQRLTLVVNKKTFSIKDILCNPENQRNSIPVDTRKPIIASMTATIDQLNNFYNQSIISSAYSYTDITDEALKRIDNMKSKIKILSYGRSLK